MTLLDSILQIGCGGLSPRRVSLEDSDSLMVTVVNDLFMDYFTIFMRSILHHNPWFNIPLLVLYGDEYSPLSAANRQVIRGIYADVSFQAVEEKRYQPFLNQTPEHMLPALYSLECFRMHEHESIVFLDCDMLCLGDISEIFTTIVDFGICPADRYRDRKERLAGIFARRVGFNTGLMVIGERYRNERTYNSFFRLRSGGLADQDILNRYFRYRPVFCFDHKYNYHAEFFWDKHGVQDDVRILHYAGKKPLAEPGLPRMKIWFEYRERLRTTDPDD